MKQPKQIPSAPDVENAVLGAMLLYPRIIAKVSPILNTDCFYNHKAQAVYDAIISLYASGQKTDIVTVVNYMRRNKTLEDALWVAELENHVVNETSTEHHALILKQYHLQRELINVGHDLYKAAFDEDPLELLPQYASRLTNISASLTMSSFEQAGAIASDVINELTLAAETEKEITGIPSGIISLDRLTEGWKEARLILVAGRPGMGKTTLALCFAHYAAKQKVPVGIFSMEMNGGELVKKLLAIDSGISGNRIKNPRTLNHPDWINLHNSAGRLNNLPVYIDKSSRNDILTMKAKCMEMKSRHNVGLFIVDYLQLMTGSGKKGQIREQEVSEISRGLKEIAMATDTPVIALSQLSRASEQRGGAKRPILSDLRESGSLEQDANQVIFVHRPGYYNASETDESGNLLPQGYTELIVAKNRHGEQAIAPGLFHPELSLFTDLNRTPTYADYANAPY